MERRFADVVVTGRRPNVMELLGPVLFAVIIYYVIAPWVIAFDSKYLPLALIFLLILNFAARIRAFRRPPRVILERGGFSLRLFSNLTLKTPAANVANIDLRANRMTVTFASLHAVEPAKLRTWLHGNFRKHGCHAMAARGTFSLEQVNQLRLALGMPVQSADLYADYEATLHQMTPRVIVTPALIAANVAMFVVMAALGAGFFMPDPQLMVQWGANFGPLTCHGQWWRLFSSLFLHFGMLHLLMNMYILRDIGPVVERMLGPVGFAIGYLVSGFFGSVASVWWHGAIVSAGATGAICGVFGMLLGLVTVHQHSIPAAIIREHRTNAIMFVVLSTALASAIPGIDIAAHLGGFVAGFLCGLVQRGNQLFGAGRRISRNLGLAAAASVAGVVAIYFLSTRSADIVALSIQAGKVDTAADASFAASMQRQESGSQTAVATSAEIRTAILPMYDDLADQLKRVPRQKGIEQDRLRTTLAEYVELKREAWELMRESIANNNLVAEGLAHLRNEAAQRLVASQSLRGHDKQTRVATSFHKEFAVLMVADAEAMQALAILYGQDSRGDVNAADLKAMFNRDVLAVWQKGTKRFLAAAKECPVQDLPIVERTRKYIDLKSAGLLLLAQSLREGDQTKSAAGYKKLEEAAEAAKEIWPKPSNVDAEDQNK